MKSFWSTHHPLVKLKIFCTLRSEGRPVKCDTSTANHWKTATWLCSESFWFWSDTEKNTKRPPFFQHDLTCKHLIWFKTWFRRNGQFMKNFLINLSTFHREEYLYSSSQRSSNKIWLQPQLAIKKLLLDFVAKLFNLILHSEQSKTGLVFSGSIYVQSFYPNQNNL